MAKYLINDTTLTGIADAIRSKTGGTEPILTSEMAGQIEGIEVSEAGAGSAANECYFTYMKCIYGSKSITGGKSNTISFSITLPPEAKQISVWSDSLYTRSTASNIDLLPENVRDFTKTESSDGVTISTKITNTVSYSATWYYLGLFIVNFALEGVTSVRTDEGLIFECAPSVSALFKYSSVLDGVSYVSGANDFVAALLENSVITAIPPYFFDSWTALKRITLPTTLNSIGSYAFQYCTSLESITLPSGISTFDTNLFRSCISLREVVFPDDMTSIPGWMFYQCTSLESITLPSSITSIDYWAFANCSSLVEIAIPSGVSTINGGAFNTCSALKIVDFSTHTSVPSLGATNVFTGTSSDLQIKVPSALYDEWIAATNWAAYADYIVGV